MGGAQQPLQQPVASTPAFDPFAAPVAQPTMASLAPVAAQVSEEKQKVPEARYVPKNKNENDAWVKGAQFIDLVNLGTKDSVEKPKVASVYINPAASTENLIGGFQP